MKNAIILMMFLVLTYNAYMQVSPSMQAPAPRYLGDVSGDGNVTTLDILKVRSHILGVRSLSPTNQLVADVDSSGSVTTLDILIMRRFILNAIAEFPGHYVNQESHITDLMVEYLPNVLLTQSRYSPERASGLLSEGIWSDKYSAVNYRPYYFLVSLPDGARVLCLAPLNVICCGNGPDGTSGITDQELVLEDVLTNEQFYFTLHTVGTMIYKWEWEEESGIVLDMGHQASGEIDGTPVHFWIKYSITPNYPIIRLTWGVGSAPNHVGIHRDFVQLELP